MLGFKFGSRPIVASHVAFIEKKFNTRVWILRHFKDAALPTKDIISVFTSSIRSVAKYAATVYHMMLSVSQSGELERMQRRCLKIIYRHRTSYDKALQLSGLTRLEERREKIFEKFAHKCATNKRLEHWFP